VDVDDVLLVVDVDEVDVDEVEGDVGEDDVVSELWVPVLEEAVVLADESPLSVVLGEQPPATIKRRSERPVKVRFMGFPR